MRLVIVGNGVAGVTTARFVADGDSSISIDIYSLDAHSYYARPRLIDLIAQRISRQDMAFYDPDWYHQRKINTHLGCRVSAVYPEKQEIELENGQTVAYDKLVLATGASSFIPPIKGSDLPGVHTLRTLDDADRLINLCATTEHMVMLGGGLLGLDSASALRSRGVDLTVVEMQPWLLPRQLDQQGAAVLQSRIEEMGMNVITGDLCTEIIGDGVVEQVVLKSGRTLDAQAVVISAGVRANADLAKAAGLKVSRGIVVDERLLTSDPHIYAVGDVTEFKGVLWSIIPAALAQARVAAAQILDKEETLYQGIVPSTTLKVSGIDLTSIGQVNSESADYVHIRQIRPGEGIYKKLVLLDGRVVGAISLGDRSDARVMNQLVNRGIDVSEHLTDLLQDGFDLKNLVRR